MLSTQKATDSVIKLVDFGCAEIYKGQSSIKKDMTRSTIANTPAYSPPEAFSKWQGPLHPSFDMFSMGLILYIMLTGCHPFDLSGRSTDDDIEHRIKTENAPLRDSSMTAHLSDSAIELLEKLLDKRPRQRMTAMELLEHPWVMGLTAETRKMEGSDTKLSQFRKFKSRLEVKIFSDWVSSATGDDANSKSGLVEREFKKFDTQNKGYLTVKDLGSTLTEKGENPSDDDKGKTPLSLSEFTDLISDHMMNKYYPEGYKIYKEGSKGKTIYFINSGTVEISTKAGFKTTLSQGNFFGEGALLSLTGRRNASVTCLTPVHVIAISKEYFKKYMIEGGSETKMNLQELTRSRDRDQAFQMLRDQKNLLKRDLSRGDVLFSYGEDGKSLFIVDEGEISIMAKNGKHVLSAKAGAICGEHSMIMKQPRNVTAVCASDKCKVREMAAKVFYKIYDSCPIMRQSLREFCLRRDFQKAIVDKLGKDFGTSEDELHKVFDSVDSEVSGEIEMNEVKGLIKRIYPQLSDDDPLFTEVLHSLDIDNSNSVNWEEFKKVFLVKNRSTKQ
jgi:CRP-like cAMP-binding protein